MKEFLTGGAFRVGKCNRRFTKLDVASDIPQALALGVLLLLLLINDLDSDLKWPTMSRWLGLRPRMT